MIYPILLVPVVLDGDQCVGHLPGAIVTVRAPARLMTALLNLCDGTRSSADIVRALQARWHPSSVKALLRALMRCGILSDAVHHALQSWPFVENPRRIGTEPAPGTVASLVARAVADAKRSPAKRYYRGPDSALGRLLRRRRSRREFSGQALPFQHLLAILAAAYGAMRGDPVLHRTVPSAGAISPLTLHLVALRPTRGLGAGVYRIHFRDNGGVGFIRIAADWRAVFRAFADPELLRYAHAVIVVSGDFRLSARKYGNRAMLYVPLEAGHAVQNALLGATECNAGAVEIGGFLESPLRSLLRAPKNLTLLSTVVLGTCVGRAAGPVPPQANTDFLWVDLSATTSRPPFHLGMAKPADWRGDADYCWGRDRDPLLAHDKAMAEAVERRACRTASKLHRARFRDLADALDPRLVVAYSPVQYSSPGFPFRLFDEKREYLWKEGIDYFSGKRVHVLADLVHFGPAMHRLLPPRPYTDATTSGVAAHTGREPALERAVLELIERDAFMRVWLGRLPARRIAAGALPRDIRQRIAQLAKLGVRVTVKSLPGGHAPVILVFAQHAEKPFTTVAAAADYDPARALDHAMMEAEAIVFLRYAGEDQRRIRPSQVKSPIDHGDLYAQRAYFRRADFLGKGTGSCTLSELRRRTPRTWSALCDRLRAQGQRLIAVDMTPDGAALAQGRIPLFVMRALVPGLIPISFGYGTEPLGLPLAQRLLVQGGRGTASNIMFPHPFP